MICVMWYLYVFKDREENAGNVPILVMLMIWSASRMN